MSTPPSTPVNKYVMHKRVEDVEKLAANCDTAIRELTARFDRQPPRGDKGETGPAGLSITGPAGRDGKDGKDGVGYAGATGPQGRPGKDCECKTALAEQRIAGIETSLRDARAETISLKAQLTTLGATVQGLLDVNKRTGEYIEWLRQRTAARIAAAQGAKQQ